MLRFKFKDDSARVEGGGAAGGGGRVLISLHFLFDLSLQQAAKTYDVWVVDLTFAGIKDAFKH